MCMYRCSKAVCVSPGGPSHAPPPAAAAAAPGCGGMKQAEQKAVLQEFREGGFNCLVATCIGEEGLDIPEVRGVWPVGAWGREGPGLRGLTLSDQLGKLHLTLTLILTLRHLSPHNRPDLDPPSPTPTLILPPLPCPPPPRSPDLPLPSPAP